MVTANEHDATQDSLRSFVAQKLPLFIPYCTNAIVNLGDGFDSRRALENKLPWTGNSVFVRGEPLDLMCELNSSAVSFQDSSSSSSYSKADRTSASLSITAGTDCLNVNVKGSYEESNSKNTQGSRASRNVSCRAGQITFRATPALTLAAREDYLSHRETFRDRYGDYYVAGLQLGGDAGLTFNLRAESEEHADSVKVSVTVHAFLWDATAETSEEHHEATSSTHFDFSGYNTLNKKWTTRKCNNAMEANDARTIARGYLDEANNLRNTVRQRIEAVNLGRNSPRTMAQCRDLCESGIVLNYILCPYEQLSEFIVLQMQAQRRAEGGLVV